MFTRCAATTVILLLFAAAMASAQSPSDRIVVESLLRHVGAVSSIGQLPVPTDCTASSAALGALCDGIVAVRRAELTRKDDDASRARDLLEQVVTEQPTWPTAWYALAASRLAADQVGLAPRAAPMQHDNAGNAAGAERALLHALTLDSGFALAARALALAPVVHDTTGRLAARVTALRHARRLLTPAILYAAAMVEREAGHLDSAVAIEVGLLKGRVVPRGLVDMALARDLFHGDQRAAAEPVYFGGANDTAQVSRDAYRRNVLLVASPAELKEWDAEPAATRIEWLRHFWAIRDLQSGRPAGSRLAEHFQRIEEALQLYRFRSIPHGGNDTLRFQGDIAYFTAEVPGAVQPFRSIGSFNDVLDDRGLMYVRQGIPHLSMRTRDGGGLELWQYVRPGQQLYLSFSAGLPPRRATQMEPWRALVLPTLGDLREFDAPTIMVPTVASPGHARYGGYFQGDFCGLKSSLCRAIPDSSSFTTPRINCTPAAEVPRISWRLGDPRYASRDRYRPPETFANIIAAMYRAPPEDAPYIYEREREEGWWMIDQATATDAFPVPFTRQMSASFEARILRHADGTARLVVAFAVPVRDLHLPDVDFAAAALSYPFHLHVSALRDRDLLRADLDTVLHLIVSGPVAERDLETGVVDLPLPAGAYRVSIWLLNQNDSSGVLVGLDSVRVGQSTVDLRVSDVVIGGTPSGTVWDSGDGPVRFNPVGSFARGSDAEIYYQVSGLLDGKSYQTRYEFFRDDERQAQQPLFAISSAMTASADPMSIRRTVGLKSLSPGIYRVRITVSGESQHAESTGCLTIDR